jgi:hypothetical protein
MDKTGKPQQIKYLPIEFLSWPASKVSDFQTSDYLKPINKTKKYEKKMLLLAYFTFVILLILKLTKLMMQ